MINDYCIINNLYYLSLVNRGYQLLFFDNGQLNANWFATSFAHVGLTRQNQMSITSNCIHGPKTLA